MGSGDGFPAHLLSRMIHVGPRAHAIDVMAADILAAADELILALQGLVGLGSVVGPGVTCPTPSPSSAASKAHLKMGGAWALATASLLI
jgi:hypothetical protein